MASAEAIAVEVVRADPCEQRLVALRVPTGTTAAQAVRLSGLAGPSDFDPERDPIGIFGRGCEPERVLRSGDRVELYRPLQADPKTARRRRAPAGREGRNA